MDGALSIPDGRFTSVGSEAFTSSADSVRSVAVGEGVASLGARAFYYCFHLTSLTLPRSLTSIGREACAYCSRLEGPLTIRAAVTHVGFAAFCNCSALTACRFQSCRVSIGPSAFRNCTSLWSVVFASDRSCVAALLACRLKRGRGAGRRERTLLALALRPSLPAPEGCRPAPNATAE